jgi:hypothetical protein
MFVCVCVNVCVCVCNPRKGFMRQTMYTDPAGIICFKALDKYSGQEAVVLTERIFVILMF